MTKICRRSHGVAYCSQSSHLASAAEKSVGQQEQNTDDGNHSNPYTTSHYGPDS